MRGAGARYGWSCPFLVTERRLVYKYIDFYWKFLLERKTDKKIHHSMLTLSNTPIHQDNVMIGFTLDQWNALDR
jgi:hypothetical protein